jgi:hypothetical protein
VQKTPLLVADRLPIATIILQVLNAIFITFWLELAHYIACILYNFVVNHLYATS